MKRLLILISIGLLAINATGQAPKQYTENDVKQFYRTIQGDYTGHLNDSTTITLHLTPIWEREDNRFQWLYLEAVNNSTKAVVEQKIIEIRPVSDIAFQVVVHGISHPESFVGKWSNRNYFDGFGTGILKGKSKFNFMKTMDYEYQSSWNRRKNLKCFPSGSKIHLKFVQADERLYVKQVSKHSTNIMGITFFKDLTD